MEDMIAGIMSPQVGMSPQEDLSHYRHVDMRITVIHIIFFNYIDLFRFLFWFRLQKMTLFCLVLLSLFLD